MDHFLNQELDKIYKWRNFQKTLPDAEIDKHLNGRSFLICEPKKRIGIEVEVENIRDIPRNFDRCLWTTHDDGSLRNGGIEFVTLAVAGKEIPAAIYNLFDNLPKDADFSERTSIHVHVNIREQTVDQLLTVLLLYITFERLLYQFAGSHRAKNIFCVPIQETRYPYILSDAFIHQSIPELIDKWKKYSGLNLRRIKDFGTLEYRHMEGHRDPIRLLRWINIILRLHRYARRNTFFDTYNEIRMLNTSSMYEHFTRQVFESDTEYLLSGNDLKGLMEIGVTTAKHITIPSPFFMSLLENMHQDSSLLRGLGLNINAKKQLTKPKTQLEQTIAALQATNQLFANADFNSNLFTTTNIRVADGMIEITDDWMNDMPDLDEVDVDENRGPM